MTNRQLTICYIYFICIDCRFNNITPGNHVSSFDHFILFRNHKIFSKFICFFFWNCISNIDCQNTIFFRTEKINSLIKWVFSIYCIVFEINSIIGSENMIFTFYNISIQQWFIQTLLIHQNSINGYPCCIKCIFIA